MPGLFRVAVSHLRPAPSPFPAFPCCFATSPFYPAIHLSAIPPSLTPAPAQILDTATGGEVAQLTEQGAASSPQAADPHLGFNGGTAIAYSADGRLIALVEDNSAKRQLSLWEVTESPASASSASVAVAQQLQHGSSSTSTGSSSGSQQQVRVRRLARLPGYRCAAFSPDGRRLVANNGELGEMNGTGDRSLVVYDVEELRREHGTVPGWGSSGQGTRGKGWEWLACW